MKQQNRTQQTARGDRKLRQLCAQVEEVVSLALGAATDQRLLDVFVQSVEPAPDGARLLVTVVPSSSSAPVSLDELLGALEHARPWLRQQVAQEIHRKRTPELAFTVAPYWKEPE